MTDPYHRPKSSKVLAISIAVQAVILLILFVCEPLRKSNMEFDPQEAKEKAKKVAKANQKRKELEKKRKEKTKLKKEDAEKLKKKEKKKRKRKLEKKLEEMREIKKEVKKKKLEKLEKLKNRSPEEIRRKEVEDLLIIIRKIKGGIFHLHARSRSPLTTQIDEGCNKLETMTKAFLDDLSKKGRKKLEKQSIAIDSLIAGELETPKYPDAADNYKLFGGEARGHIKKFLFLLEELTFDTPEMDKSLEELIEQEQAEVDETDTPISDMSLEEVFEEIEQLEEEITEEYSEYKAAEIADIQNTSFDEALETVQSALNQQDNQNGEKQEGQRGEKQEGQGGKKQEGGQGGEKQEGGQGGEKQEGGQGGEKQEGGQGGEKQEGGQGGEKQEGGQGGQKQQGDQGGQKQQGGQGGQKAMTVGDLNRMRAQLDKQTTKAMQSYSKAQNMGMQAGAKTGKQGRNAQAMMPPGKKGGAQGSQGNTEGGGGGKATAGRGRNKTGSKGSAVNATTKAITKGKVKIPEAMVKAKALPGRKFEKNSKRKGWLYLDTWYIIGPWDNKGKLDYKITHQPEMEIDFDAEYKDGKIDEKTGKPRELKWKFVQSNHMKIKIPDERSNSTYYCYTEVYFEEAAEMLLAIASDDAARLWVNDKLVWEDHGLSGWDLSEGFRMVKFKKGFNKIRVRIENFPKLCEFSVLLCPSNNK